MRKIFWLCTIALLAACGDEETDDKTEKLKMADGKEITVRTDTLCLFPNDEFEPMNTIVINPDETECLKRYTAMKAEPVWMKAKFGDWCGKLGLTPEKEYVIRREYYTQTIAENQNKMPIPFVLDSSGMGLWEYSDGKRVIGFHCTIGTTKINGILGNSCTFLIYISDGNVIGKYFPCEPQDLEWHYSWYDGKVTNKHNEGELYSEITLKKGKYEAKVLSLEN